MKLLVNYADVSYYYYLSCMLMYYHMEWKINYFIFYLIYFMIKVVALVSCCFAHF
jgi:hypothetical protein